MLPLLDSCALSPPSSLNLPSCFERKATMPNVVGLLLLTTGLEFKQCTCRPSHQAVQKSKPSSRQTCQIVSLTVIVSKPPGR